ncbi:EamA family transporter [Nocardia arthritidis]|uniref:EamA family transporter n=1 Tax=Nocardia arthritidis TaxID=228602 RepID=A0A6G9YED1_9NOCA|nr:EamA family transporter [Nocardia arthritidis]QIS11524.1 EamA family transporter [Nocardia arthritidis]
MGELMALSAAGCFGITHFVSGLAARRAPGMVVSLYAQLGGTAIAIIAALLWQHGPATISAVGWGALSGAGTGVGVAFLYRAMSSGAFSVVVPISDVGAVAIPVLIGLTVLGEHPGWTGLLGIVVALPAIWLISAGPATTGHVTGPSAVRDSLIAGVGFAVQFLGMTRIPLSAGLWPVVVSRVVSVLVIMSLVLATVSNRRMPAGWGCAAAGAGAIGSVAIILYWIATHQQLMAVATVLAALYPAIPVLLALIFLRERVNRRQTAGLLGAATAIALLALP